LAGAEEDPESSADGRWLSCRANFTLKLPRPGVNPPAEPAHSSLCDGVTPLASSRRCASPAAATGAPPSQSARGNGRAA